MQDNADQPKSLSQLLRESYLAEARAQQHHGCSDASSSRLQIYGSLKGKAEDSDGHNYPQLPDLSAFLSQDELDKSVSLARQAIRHESCEERAEVMVTAMPSTPSNIYSPCVSTSEPSPGPLAEPPANFAVPFTQPAPEFKELPAHINFTPHRNKQKAPTRQENMTSSSRDSSEVFHDFNRPGKNVPYGLETQSKKEFLNKAADFIEELSSLFKANSSKRIRPRGCKTHKSRNQNKSKNDGTVYPLSPDNRERIAVPMEQKGRPSPAISHQTEVQLTHGIGHAECLDCRITEEEQQDSVSQEVEKEAESCALTETPSPAEPVCEPPHFIQKLKSREVPEGSKVQLDCIVRGLPAPEVRWFCEGKELENSPDIQIITNGKLHSLIITEAFEEDTGRYSCFASNFCGTDSTSAEIYVEGASSSDSEGEQHFEYVAQLQRRSFSPPSQVLSADESAQPPVQTEDPVEHPSSPAPNQIIPVPLQPVQTTTIIPVPELHKTSKASTVYSELPETQEPSTPISAASSVLPWLPALTRMTPPESQATNHNRLQGLNNQPIMAAPVFAKSLQDLVTSEGQLVVLECRVKGAPSPQVEWYREGTIIDDSPDFRILQKKDICTLVIAEVLPEDSGMFTCTASNRFGTVSTTAALTVKGNGSNHMRPLTCSIKDPTPAGPTVNTQLEVTVTNSIKPRSSIIRLDPLLSSTLRLDSLNSSTRRLDSHNSSVLRTDALCTSLPSLEPSILNSSSCINSTSTSNRNLDPHESSEALPEPQSSRQVLSHPNPFSSLTAFETSAEHEVPSLKSSDTSLRVKGTSTHQNESPIVVPLPDPPPNSCLKTGTLTNHKDSRSSSRVGLRVHFKLPEDEEEKQSDASIRSDEDTAQMLVNKEPPPVRAKPKLDPVQLQLLHDQVLMEQQQETEPQTQTCVHLQCHSTAQFQIQPEVQSSQEGPSLSPRMHREHLTSFQSYPNTIMAPTQKPLSAPTIATTSPASFLSSSPVVNTTLSPNLNMSPAPPLSSPASIPNLKTSSLGTSSQPAPQLGTAPPLSMAPVTKMNTIHASHLNLSSAVIGRMTSTTNSFSPLAPKFSPSNTDSTPAMQEITSPAPLLRRTHASLMNLTLPSHSFNYTRPKEFIASQTFSPVRSPSPTESPVPLLATELHSSATSSPTLPPLSKQSRVFPMRVLKSPTSPPSLVSSPTPELTTFLNSMLVIRAQSPPQTSSPTSNSSTPSPIQNPVAFLSSVLPSLPLSQPTNSMGLPRGAPLGLKKNIPKMRLQSTDGLHEGKETLIHDLEKMLQFSDDTRHFAHQQRLNIEGKTASRSHGPNIPATVINYDEEYKVSSFEQRLMSEIEYRLERTPVEESDDEVQHDDVPTGKCITPIFDKKLKNFRAMEGVPVTLSCKVVGIPVPKVYWFKDGNQILRKNTHYKKIRKGDGICSLHIESTTNDDDGNYTVMAANPQGRISCSGHLIVQTGPPRNQLAPIHSQRVRARIQEVEGEQTQEHFFRPHFLQAPGDMLAHEGRLCRLDCKVSGLPNPELMWLVNGKPIYPDTYHKMLVRENGIHSLVIDPLTQKDAGTYTCIASNKAGQSSFSLDLKVVEKEMKHPPQFLEKLQNMGIPEGSPVRLECRVVGMPPPAIFWKKDNDTIPKTKDRISMSQDATGYVCLLIQPTTKDDAGWYTMSAKNEAGIISCTCRLDIYAQWHQDIPAPMRKVPRTGSCYAALSGQGLDIKSTFATSENSPILFASSPPEAMMESEEL